jgi:hypothetical protein
MKVNMKIIPGDSVERQKPVLQFVRYVLFKNLVVLSELGVPVYAVDFGARVSRHCFLGSGLGVGLRRRSCIRAADHTSCNFGFIMLEILKTVIKSFWEIKITHWRKVLPIHP